MGSKGDIADNRKNFNAMWGEEVNWKIKSSKPAIQTRLLAQELDNIKKRCGGKGRIGDDILAYVDDKLRLSAQATPISNNNFAEWGGDHPPETL